MRGRAFVRLLMEMQKLQRSRNGVTLRELAEETGVTTRTIRRDLETLQDAGVALFDDLVDDGGRMPSRRWRVLDAAVS
jgi:predicted DNA-binding transcriptional regulator YafY